MHNTKVNSIHLTLSDHQSCHTSSLLLTMVLSILLDSANASAVLFHMTCQNGNIALMDYSVLFMTHDTQCTNSDCRETWKMLVLTFKQ
jgi:hypothetical protein